MSAKVIFEEVEKYLLEEGLLDDISQWKTLNIDYHPPHVHRIYTQLNSMRVSLHKIFPCNPKEALLHPHPWAASFKIYKGSYFSQIGISETADPPEKMTDLYLTPGSMATMKNPHEWHMVAPLKNVAYTMMINGPAYSEEEMNPGVESSPKQLFELELSVAQDMLKEFKTLIENQVED